MEDSHHPNEGEKPPASSDPGRPARPDRTVDVQSAPSQPVLPTFYDPASPPPPSSSDPSPGEDPGPTAIVPPPGRPVVPSRRDRKSRPPSPSGDRSSEFPVPERLGDYSIIRPLGRGGMGQVYLGFDPKLERYVAIKVILESRGDNPAYLERLRREARAAARLHHPGIVAVHSMGEEDDRIFFVMEYVEGTDLGTLIRREGPLPAARALDAIRQAAEALSYAWDHHIIHRDIKPSNLLVTRDGQVKVADFGLAKQLGGDMSLTHSGSTVGSPYYMSPEQALGESVDFRTDIYALGCSLFCLLTGQVPYEATSPLAVLVKHTHDPIPNPPQVSRPLDGQLSRLLDWMMAKSAADRPDSYGDLLVKLRRLVTLCESSAQGSDTLPVERPVAGGPSQVALGRGGTLQAPQRTPPSSDGLQSGSSSPSAVPWIARRRRPVIIATAIGSILVILAIGLYLGNRQRDGAGPQGLSPSDQRVPADTIAGVSSSSESDLLMAGDTTARTSINQPQTLSSTSGLVPFPQPTAVAPPPTAPAPPRMGFPAPEDLGNPQLRRPRGMMGIVRELRLWEFEQATKLIEEDLARTDLPPIEHERLAALGFAAWELAAHRDQFLEKVRPLLPRLVELNGQEYSMVETSRDGIEVESPGGDRQRLRWSDMAPEQAEKIFLNALPPTDPDTQYRTALLQALLQSPDAQATWMTYRAAHEGEPDFPDREKAWRTLERIPVFQPYPPPPMPGDDAAGPPPFRPRLRPPQP